ncbi:hypothetical protein [Mesorhizobium sp. ES1-4]|uniref:hypothetical protein n=1 Tax=Mesorhizobium sp. ES1-4 TaxID=2876627 RepID=UPI001CCB53F9|nr:hypothetical protein [Mesorhizobium sp. ES1-4]MBZ9798735.1 hypothetical protein [Mesorhizobium sp. ES1-4]
MRAASHQEIRDHFVEVRDRLKRSGWDSNRIADELGVARQTSYQYAFQPGAKGTRLIPADKLDRLRTAARGQFPWLTREQRLWIVLGPQLELLLETTQPGFGESYAARHRGSCMPGKENVKPDYRLPPDEALCVEWLGWRHGGLAAKADAMAVAEVDEYLIERVGLENTGWRIMPTEAQVAALRDIHERRFRDAA